MAQTLLCSRRFLHNLWLEGLYEPYQPFFWEGAICSILTVDVCFLVESKKYKFLDSHQAILIPKSLEEVREEYFDERGVLENRLQEWYTVMSG